MFNTICHGRTENAEVSECDLDVATALADMRGLFEDTEDEDATEDASAVFAISWPMRYDLGVVSSIDLC